MADFLNINRIVPRSRYNQDLNWALRNEVRDPLWTLLRQQQMGEFKAFDGGGLVKATVSYSTANPVALVSRNTNPLTNSNEIIRDLSKPIESQIQHQRYWSFDLYALAEFTKRFKLVLKAAGALDSEVETVINDLIQRYPVVLPELDETIDSINEGVALLESKKRLKEKYLLWKDKVFDVNKLCQYPSNVAYPNADEFVGNVQPLLNLHHLNGLHEGLKGFYVQAQEAGIAAPSLSFWNERELTYQFDMKVQGGAGGTYTLLEAPDYSFGDIDWYQFDYNGRNDTPIEQIDTFQSFTREYIPATFNFFGKPANRWWQFEDYKVSFDGIKPASSSDTSVLALHQFSLLYSNDWFIVPISVPLDSLVRVTNVVVEDHFGNSYTIKAQPTRENGIQNPQRPIPWSIFTPSSDLSDSLGLDAFYAAGSKAFRQESPPIEEVSFIKDEMGNLFYAVETKVPDGMGGAMDGGELNLAMQDFFSKNLPVIPPLSAAASNNPKYEFKLGNPTLENWIPFVATKVNGVDVYQRAKFPRYIDDRYNPSVQYVRPKTSILNASNSIVPLSQMMINRTRLSSYGTTIGYKWNRMRWRDGKISYWLSAYNRLGNIPELSYTQQFDKLTKTKISPSAENTDLPKFKLEWVPNRLAHFNAETLGAMATGDEVNVWPSKITGRNPLDISASGNGDKPAFEEDGIGGKAAVRFNSVVELNASYALSNTPLTIFLVYQGIPQLGPNTIFSLRYSGAGNDDLLFGCELEQGYANAEFYFQLPGQQGSDIRLKSYYSQDARPVLVSLSIADRNQSVALDKLINFRLNGYSTGSLELQGTLAAGDSYKVVSYDTLVLGKTVSGLNGLVSELIIYNRELTPREVAAIEEALKIKYGL